MRWQLEVTFEEARAHLGVETQRQWSELAIGRTTPALLGLFALVTVLADGLLQGQESVARSAVWYSKPLPTMTARFVKTPEPTFSDSAFLSRERGEEPSSALAARQTGTAPSYTAS
jgi:hypothetical protein